MSMMKRIFCFLTACILMSAVFSCTEKDDVLSPDEDGSGNTVTEGNLQQLSEGPFLIGISDLHASYCKVKVTPDSKDKPYYCGVVTEDYLTVYGDLDDLSNTVRYYLNSVFKEYKDGPLSDLWKMDEYMRDVEGLSPEMNFVVFACHVDDSGNIVSDIEAVKTRTTKVIMSENVLDINIDEVSAVDARIHIIPSNDDRYVWMELPDYVYEGLSDSRLQSMLLNYYKPFFASNAVSGENVYYFKGVLEPETDYMIVAFGYDGDITTPLYKGFFKTDPPGDPSGVTFSFEYPSMTSRSVKVIFTPSDLSVSYVAILAEEDLLNEFGGADGEGVKALLDSEIQKTIRYGECRSRADFVENYGHRGVRDISFSMTPGKKHYVCAVCMDKEGNYASEVTMELVVAPDEKETSATVSATFSNYYDGDALADYDNLYEEYAGFAVLPVTFELKDGAESALYSVYSSDVLEEEGADDADVRELMLDNDFLGIYTFYAQDREILQLDWNYDYKLFMIAFDKDNNAGELVTMDIPAMSRNGASPASGFWM